MALHGPRRAPGQRLSAGRGARCAAGVGNGALPCLPFLSGLAARSGGSLAADAQAPGRREAVSAAARQQREGEVAGADGLRRTGEEGRPEGSSGPEHKAGGLHRPAGAQRSRLGRCRAPGRHGAGSAGGKPGPGGKQQAGACQCGARSSALVSWAAGEGSLGPSREDGQGWGDGAEGAAQPGSLRGGGRGYRRGDPASGTSPSLRARSVTLRVFTDHPPGCWAANPASLTAAAAGAARVTGKPVAPARQDRLSLGRRVIVAQAQSGWSLKAC